MTADEFERAYAERSGITVEQLRSWGRVVKPCDCGDAICEGWQSVNGKDWDDFHPAPSTERRSATTAKAMR